MCKGTCTYQKGDLVTIKQDAFVLLESLSDGVPSEYKTVKTPINALFLGDKITEEVYEYLMLFSPMKRPCKLAVGSRIYYSDISYINYYQKRRNKNDEEIS